MQIFQSFGSWVADFWQIRVGNTAKKGPFSWLFILFAWSKISYLFCSRNHESNSIGKIHCPCQIWQRRRKKFAVKKLPVLYQLTHTIDHMKPCYAEEGTVLGVLIVSNLSILPSIVRSQFNLWKILISH